MGKQTKLKMTRAGLIIISLVMTVNFVMGIWGMYDPAIALAGITAIGALIGAYNAASVIRDNSYERNQNGGDPQ